jgi:hypothetical protein
MPAIVGDAYRPVRVERDVDPVAMPGQRLVDRIVGDFENHVVETRSVIGVANIHSGTFAHRVQPFEDLDAVGAIGVLLGFISHEKPIGKGAEKPKRKEEC